MVITKKKINLVEEVIEKLWNKDLKELLAYQKEIQPKGIRKWFGIYSSYEHRYEDIAINVILKQKHNIENKLN